MNTLQPTEIKAAPWLVLDVETYHGNPEETPKWMRDHWWPDVRLTPENIGKRFKEKDAETREKMALLDLAEIATIQLATPEGSVLLHKFGPGAVRWFEPEPGLGAWVLGFETEAELLMAFRTFAEQRTDDGTDLVGWNIEGFDLRKLRGRCLHRNNLVNPPRLLRSAQPVCDMMERYARDWSVDRVPFVKLEVALEVFGIPNHKADMDGSMVGRLIAEKRFEEVLAYGLRDVAAERELYLRMTGRSAALR